MFWKHCSGDRFSISWNGHPSMTRCLCKTFHNAWWTSRELQKLIITLRMFLAFVLSVQYPQTWEKVVTRQRNAILPHTQRMFRTWVMPAHPWTLSEVANTTLIFFFLAGAILVQTPPHARNRLGQELSVSAVWRTLTQKNDFWEADIYEHKLPHIQNVVMGSVTSWLHHRWYCLHIL